MADALIGSLGRVGAPCGEEEGRLVVQLGLLGMGALLT